MEQAQPNLIVDAGQVQLLEQRVGQGGELLCQWSQREPVIPRYRVGDESPSVVCPARLTRWHLRHPSLLPAVCRPV